MIDRSQLQALAELRKLLGTCSNLRKLGLTCSSAFVGDGHLTLCVPDWQIPPLKSLKLRHMMLAATTAAGWQDFMHWETLEVLHCTDIDFFPGISASLQRLRSLKVHPGESSPDQFHAFFDFVETSSTLQELCMEDMIEQVRAHKFLEGKYSALKSICIYEKVSRLGFSESSVLSSDEVKMLGKACPALQRCSIGIEMWSEWVSSLFSMKQFPIILILTKRSLF